MKVFRFYPILKKNHRGFLNNEMSKSSHLRFLSFKMVWQRQSQRLFTIPPGLLSKRAAIKGGNLLTDSSQTGGDPALFQQQFGIFFRTQMVQKSLAITRRWYEVSSSGEETYSYKESGLWIFSELLCRSEEWKVTSKRFSDILKQGADAPCFNISGMPGSNCSLLTGSKPHEKAFHAALEQFFNH